MHAMFFEEHEHFLLHISSYHFPSRNLTHITLSVSNCQSVTSSPENVIFMLYAIVWRLHRWTKLIGVRLFFKVLNQVSSLRSKKKRQTQAAFSLFLISIHDIVVWQEVLFNRNRWWTMNALRYPNQITNNHGVHNGTINLNVDYARARYHPITNDTKNKCSCGQHFL